MRYQLRGRALKLWIVLKGFFFIKGDCTDLCRCCSPIHPWSGPLTSTIVCRWDRVKSVRLTGLSVWKDSITYAPINSRPQHPPPSRAKPAHLNFWRLDRSNSRPLEPKWCSNALPYHRICLSYPTKEQSSSAPAVFNKDLLKTFFVSQSLTNATSPFPFVQTRVL